MESQQPHASRRGLTSRRVLALAAGALALAALLAGPASGHAIVESTDPDIDEVVAEPPGSVRMDFNEPVEIAFGAIRVFDTHGRRVDAGEAEHLSGRPDAIAVPLAPDLAAGTYTVTWRVVSADGHPIEEAFVFHVGTPGENPQGIAEQLFSGQAGAGPLEGLLAGMGRWLSFISLLLLAGAAVFFVAVWRVAARREGPRAPEVEQRFFTRWRRVLVGAWTGAMVATVLLYLLQGAMAADLPLREALSAEILGKMSETRFGLVSLVRLGLLVAAAGLWLALRRRLEPRADRSVGAAAAPVLVPVWALVAGGLIVVALLATPGLSGHAGTTPPLAANIPADTLHMLGAATWLGGLLLLIAAAFPATRRLAVRERVRSLAPVVARFSDLAMVAVAAIVLSGLFRSWTEVRALRALTGATYGIVLLVKVAAFLPILVLGAVNNRWTKPRMERAVADDAPERAPLGVLRRLVVVEVVLVTVVVGITAFLVNLAPARVEAGVTGPFITDVPVAENNLNVLVDPNQVGENEVHLTATKPSGLPLPVEDMRVLFRMPSSGIGPLVGEATELSEGHFVVQGRQLSVAGEWQLEIVLRMSRFEEERVTTTVTVNP